MEETGVLGGNHPGQCGQGQEVTSGHNYSTYSSAVCDHDVFVTNISGHNVQHIVLSFVTMTCL